MSPPNLNFDGNGFAGHQSSNFLYLPPAPMEVKDDLGERVTKGFGGHIGFERKGTSLELGERVEGLVAKRTGHAKLCARGHWRPDEDVKLVKLVDQYGPQNWNLIAENFQGRSGKSCRLRWCNQLDPRINKGAFSEEEEERLLSAHRLYGTKWAMIAKLFPGRTDNAVKNHWHVIMARNLRQRFTICGKRKLCAPPPPPQALPVNNHKVSCSDSTNSRTMDESASGCTDLSLTPSSARGPTSGIFNRQTQDHCEKAVMGEGSGGADDKFYSNGIGNGVSAESVIGVVMDQSASNSEVSAAESNSNWTSLIPNPKHSSSFMSENRNDQKKLKVTFFDFLGVGAC